MSASGAAIDTMPVKTEMSSTSGTLNKVCSVCGDSALGYNFNALSCESCKAFFRRNAPKDKEFKCPFKEDCAMTPVTRRFCQRCRLQKCFAVGMRKEYIMSEEERQSKRQKIEQNRARKRCSQNLNDGTELNGASNKMPRLISGSTEWHDIQSPAFSQLDALSPQRPVDGLEAFPSPSTAASAGGIPSPNSPPESATVAASDNVEMLARFTTMIDMDRSYTGTQTDVSPPPPVSPSLSTGHDVLPIHPMKMLRTAWTQTVPSQSTPLLTSLISSPTSVREATTSPRPNFDHTAPPPASWSDSMSPWLSCIPSGLPSGEMGRDALQDVLRMGVFPTSIESILSEALRLEYSTYTPPLALSHASALSASLSHNRELNDAERAKLNELIVANKALNVPVDEIHHKNQDGEPMLLDIINLTAVVIRRLIKMTKKISAFKNMCQEDQVALLKGACMEMLILRGAMNYNPERDTWDLPPGSNARVKNISVNVLKEARGNLYQEHQRFQRSFDPRCRSDENIMLILSAIALFTPERSCVVHHDVVRLEQSSYYYLLRRYLECTFPGCEARSTFLKLIQKMSELHRLNEEHVRAYLDVDPSEVEPLLIEIFDLKTQSRTKCKEEPS